MINLTQKTTKIFLLFLLVVVFLIIFFLRTPPPPQVLKTFPPPNKKYVLTTAQISFLFSQNIPSKHLPLLQIKLNPTTPFSYTLKNNLLTITPQKELSPSTTYQLTLLWHHKPFYTLTFSTNILSQQQLLKGLEQQTQDDFEFGKVTKQAIETKYPWYPSLPIDTPQYTIVYDFSQQLFRLIVKTSTLDQKIITSALKKLKALGVKEPIPYKVIHRPSPPN